MVNTKLWMLPFRQSSFKDIPYQNTGKYSHLLKHPGKTNDEYKALDVAF